MLRGKKEKKSEEGGVGVRGGTKYVVGWVCGEGERMVKEEKKSQSASQKEGK